MKKLLALLLSMMMIFSLAACGEETSVYTVEKNGQVFVIDRENSTVSDGTYTYEFTFSGDSGSYSINITYPNGADYYWSKSGSTGSGGWSDDYDSELYTDGDLLCDVIAEKAPSPAEPGKGFAVILLLAVGAFNIAAPAKAWYLNTGWRFKDVEPSDSALLIRRIGGGIAVIAAIAMIFT